jgi:predicted ATPase
MLKKLTIKNFKAIQNMTIEFTPLTVLIGGNGCGKSTVLQALDFLRSASIRDIPEYLREKGWTFGELKSQFNKEENEPITFISMFELIVNGKNESIEWIFIINQVDNQLVVKEEINKTSDNSVIFSRGFGRRGPVIAGGTGAYAGNSFAVAHDINEIILEASWLKYLQLVKDSPELSSLKKFLLGSTYFGLLSPDNIRTGDRNEFAVDIGLSGVSLAPFIHGLIDDQKDALNKIVSNLVGFPVKINTVDLGGKIEFYIEESFDDSSTKINKDHISDGLLRIISFVAIVLQKKIILTPPTGQDITPIDNEFQITVGRLEEPDGMVLLDEIENGINPYLAEKINGLLNGLIEASKRQVIITTHSPVILNDINPGYINLLWRDKSGAVYSRKLFSISELHDSLDFLSPGDAWMNIREEDLLAKASSEPEGKE